MKKIPLVELLTDVGKASGEKMNKTLKKDDSHTEVKNNKVVFSNPV